MRKWLRITIIVFSGLIGLLLLLWLALAFYIHTHKAYILQQISDQLNDRLHGGELSIGNMEPALIQSFPDVSVSLQEVSVKDSLWAQHKHELVHVSRLFVQVNTLALLRKQLDIKQISLKNGTIYFYTDSTGYSNASVLKKKEENVKTTKGSRTNADITRMNLEHVRLVLDNQLKGKSFDFDIARLKGSFLTNDSGWTAHVDMNLKVHSFAFNTEKGSFLKDKNLSTALELHFNTKKKVLDIPQQVLRVDDKQDLAVGANFSFAGDKAFTIHIIAEKLSLAHVATMLTPKIAQKLDSIHMEKPLDAACVINGSLGKRGTPLLYVSWKTTNNNVTTKGLELTECSFSGSYSNDWVPGNGHGDDNSIISLYNLNTRCFSIPVTADTVHISNLQHPALTGFFRADFPLTNLNADGVFNFTSGIAKAHLYYKGGITAGDTIKPYLKGTVEVLHGALAYTPRNLQFTDCNARLDFTGQDLYLQNISVQTAKSKLFMEGSVLNITNLFFTAPEKLQLDWKVRSPILDLNEFRSFLAQRGKVVQSRAATRRKMARITGQLDVMLNACNVNLNVQLDKLIYQRFIAHQVKADLALTQSAIKLNQIALSHAGGSIRLSGDIRQNGNSNRFKVNTDINNVHVDQLFYAFNDFGMQALNSKNLRGILSAKANLSGNISDNGRVAPKSLYGTMGFELRQGALVHVSQLEDIGNIAFRKRDMGNITFENVKNSLTIQGDKVLVPPMQINSSVLYMDVSGVYGMTSGTDLYIDVPLRNPRKDEDIDDKELKRKRRTKGIVLHLHATDDSNGKVKIKLGSKKKDEEKDVTN
ncbi:AsmA family protein [Chitinophaga sp.]|uniref:AsmA family protein n=1 Tax=Chitinophaga sp. TaxID=1869181 RepID=UPI0031D6D98F